MSRFFEKISLKQFIKDTNLDESTYNSFNLPKRSTKNSAGYDFEALSSFTLKPNESKLIPLGIKAKMNEDEILMIFVRSSQGIKYNIRMCNQVGIIDSDYYNNEDNEGHIFIKLQNEGEKDYTVKKGDKIAQGVFINFLKIDNEEENINQRKGGFGSTNKRE